MVEDPNSRAYGTAHHAVLTHLLRALIDKEVVTKGEAERVLRDAEQELLAHRTQVADGGAGLVRAIRESLLPRGGPDEQ